VKASKTMYRRYDDQHFSIWHIWVYVKDAFICLQEVLTVKHGHQGSLGDQVAQFGTTFIHKRKGECTVTQIFGGLSPKAPDMCYPQKLTYLELDMQVMFNLRWSLLVTNKFTKLISLSTSIIVSLFSLSQLLIPLPLLLFTILLLFIFT
jgi:hypothetical protein